ncbi:MAG: hypothetical protein ACXQTS_06255, partial [Candidatus Methanospirareceae archaeon]
MEKGRKVMIGLAMAAIVAIAMMAVVPMVSAVYGVTHNIITPGVSNPVLIGQKLQFQAPDLGNPIIGHSPDEIEGRAFGTATADYDTASWFTTEGTYFVDLDGDATLDAGETTLSVTEPLMKIETKVFAAGKTEAVDTITIGTPLLIDFTNNLDPNDVVDLRITGPDGLLTVNPANPAQVFDDITVNYLITNYGVGSAGIDTTGWTLGEYTIQVVTEDEQAEGLAMSSNTKTLVVMKGAIEINAEKTTVAELESLKLTVTGVAGRTVDIDVPTNARFPGGMEDNPAATTVGPATITDTIDADGVRTYVVEFTDTGSYSIEVTDYGPDGVLGTPDDDSDSVDITVVEREVIFDIPTTVVIGEKITIKGTANTGTTVDVWVNDVLYPQLDDIVIEADGTFSKEVRTTDIGISVPGSVRLKAWIDSPITAPSTTPPTITPDGDIALLAVRPSLTAELSTPRIACGDDFTISGIAEGSTAVNILIVSPKGSGGTLIDGTGIGIYNDIASVSEVDHTFSKKITVGDNVDTGDYLIAVLSPGGDGNYNGLPPGTGVANLVAQLAANYNLAGKTQEQLASIVKDATVNAAGSDD